MYICVGLDKFPKPHLEMCRFRILEIAKIIRTKHNSERQKSSRHSKNFACAAVTLYKAVKHFVYGRRNKSRTCDLPVAIPPVRAIFSMSFGRNYAELCASAGMFKSSSSAGAMRSSMKVFHSWHWGHCQRSSVLR